MAENIVPETNKIDDIEVVHKGNWLSTSLIKYTDPNGTKREWEAVGYNRNNTNKLMPDSVQVIAILKRNLHHNCFVLVQQFRPPVGCYCIEFPAGLVDSSDKNVQETALRELKEETGFTGTVSEESHLGAPLSLDPGAQSSTITTVHVVIDGDDSRNINCAQHLDDGEFIKVLIIPVRDLLHRLNQFITDEKEKFIIDSRLYSFAMGLDIGSALSTKDKPLENVI